MNSSVNTEQAPSALDSLAMQARSFVQGACMNLLQLGRVLKEARPLVSHGEWEAWCRVNAKMSVRTAEQYMQAYEEFGLDARIAELGSSKVFKLLPMTGEERQRLMEENDISSMKTRELDEAIKRQREAIRAEAMAEAQTAIEAEREARIRAEQRADEAESRPSAIPDDVANELREKDGAIEQYRSELDRAGKMQAELIEQRNSANKALSEVRRDLEETEAMLAESQQEYNRMQAELLNAQSIIAKGDAERSVSQQLTAEEFASAVSQFIGCVAQMPFMGSSFAAMKHDEFSKYDKFLMTVEDWAHRARAAMNTVECEVIMDGE